MNGTLTCFPCSYPQSFCNFNYCYGYQIAMVCFYTFALLYGIIRLPYFLKLNSVTTNASSPRPFVKFIYHQKLKIYIISLIGSLSFICKGMIYYTAPPDESSFERFLIGDFFYRFAPIQIIVTFLIFIETSIIIVRYFDLLSAEIPKIFQWGILIYDALLLILLVVLEILASKMPLKWNSLVQIHTFVLYITSFLFIVIAIIYGYKLRNFFKTVNIKRAITKKMTFYIALIFFYIVLFTCLFIAIFSYVYNRPIVIDLMSTYSVWTGVMLIFTCLSFHFNISSANVKRMTSEKSLSVEISMNSSKRTSMERDNSPSNL